MLHSKFHPMNWIGWLAGRLLDSWLELVMCSIHFMILTIFGWCISAKYNYIWNELMDMSFSHSFTHSFVHSEKERTKNSSRLAWFIFIFASQKKKLYSLFGTSMSLLLARKKADHQQPFLFISSYLIIIGMDIVNKRERKFVETSGMIVNNFFPHPLPSHSPSWPAWLWI